MRQRALIAMALACRPRLLIADEPTTALDVTIQAQILALLKTLVVEHGTALIMITHDLGVVAGLVDEVNVLYGGRVVERADRHELFAAPRHPYTHGLLESIPRLDAPPGERLTPIRGSVTTTSRGRHGCAFAPRCSREIDACREVTPELRPYGHGRAGPPAALPQPGRADDGRHRRRRRARGRADDRRRGRRRMTAWEGDRIDQSAGRDHGGRGVATRSLEAAPQERAATSRSRRRTRPAAELSAATAGADVLLEVNDLKVHFPIKRGVLIDKTIGYVYAVDGVSLAVRRGETYGLVGESGCGKTTLGRGILRLVEPTGGSVIFDGENIAALKPEPLRRARRRMQMVFQDPLSSLDPRQSVQSILVEGMKAHGLADSDAETNARLRELLAAVGLPNTALRKYPHEFSGGQRQRIGIARALTVNPELIVADEPVSALDVSVQAQVINLLEDLQARPRPDLPVIAHDLAVVRHISDRVGVMYLGALVEEATSEALYAEPLHPYTQGAAVRGAGARPGGGGQPRADPAHRRPAVAGEPAVRLPVPHPLPVAAAGRCATPTGRSCIELRPGHRVACHYADRDRLRARCNRTR